MLDKGLFIGYYHFILSAICIRSTARKGRVAVWDFVQRAGEGESPPRSNGEDGPGAVKLNFGSPETGFAG